MPFDARIASCSISRKFFQVYVKLGINLFEFFNSNITDNVNHEGA